MSFLFRPKNKQPNSTRSASTSFIFSETPNMAFRKNQWVTKDHYSYQSFKELLAQLKYCESKVLIYLNNQHGEAGGINEENLEILNDMTNCLVYLNGMTQRFLPDKKGGSWFNAVITEIQEEEDMDVEEARKQAKNSIGKKKGKDGSEEKETRRISFKTQRRSSRARNSSLRGSIASVNPQRYYLSDSSTSFDFKSLFLQPEHLSYFLNQYSQHNEVLSISNKFNKIEEYMTGMQLRMQNEYHQFEKDYNEFLKENAEEIDKEARDLVRNNDNLFQNDLKMNELLFQYVLKIKYLEQITTKTTRDLERLTESSYQCADLLNHSFQVLLDLQINMPEDLQAKLKEQMNEVMTYFEQLDYMVMVEEQLEEQERLKQKRKHSSVDEIAFNLQSATKWEIEQKYMQKKEELKQGEILTGRKKSDMKEELSDTVKQLSQDIKKGIVKNEFVAPHEIQNSPSPNIPYLGYQIGSHFSYFLYPIQQSNLLAVDAGEGQIQVLNWESYSVMATLDLSEGGKNSMHYFGIEVADSLFLGNKDHLFEFTMNSTDPYSLEQFSRESLIHLKSHGRALVQHTNNKVNEVGKFVLVGETEGWIEMVECERVDSNGKASSVVVMRHQVRNLGTILTIAKTKRNTEIKDIKSGIEYVFGCQKGVHFGTVHMSSHGHWEINFSTEYYMNTSKVLQAYEYEIDKFFFLSESDPEITILDRKRKKIVGKIQNPSYQRPQPLQFLPFPSAGSPFIFLRDAKNLSVVNVKSKAIYTLLKDVGLTDNAECKDSFWVSLGQELPNGAAELSVHLPNDRKAMEDYLGKPGSIEENKSALEQNESPSKVVPGKKYQLEVNLLQHVPEAGEYSSKVIQYILSADVVKALEIIEQT